MNTTARVPDSNIYWSMLKNLSNEMKIELIAKLSNSLLSSKKKEEVPSASYFYGIWKDSEPADADELAEEVRAGRKFKDDIEAF